ncbi:hypothetical protein AURDEDRAFT_155798 [Auricularia subglabra TFB-10046 SS5]|nr:hypothetical protein AURDEDRAFT_155798 [Auricularia subglabra TFB-10046 SS5]
MPATPGSSNTPGAASPIDALNDDQQYSKEDAAILERYATHGRRPHYRRARAAKSKANVRSAAELRKKNAPLLPPPAPRTDWFKSGWGH